MEITYRNFDTEFPPAVIGNSISTVNKTIRKYSKKEVVSYTADWASRVLAEISNIIEAHICTSDTISIEEFKQIYLADVDEKDLFDDFKKDLWEEVLEAKISKIKYYRIINKFTQDQLAKMFKTQQPNIARLEKVGSKISVAGAKKLGKVFKIDYKDLLE